MKSKAESSRWIRGALRGGLLAAGYFACDAIGAYAALPELLDPTLDTLLLVALGAAHAIGWGILIGTLAAGLTYPRYLRALWRPRFAMVAALLLIGLGYGFRVERVLLDAGDEGRRSDAPPVLFVLVDTLRADTLYGGGLEFPLTPAFAEQARDAHVFLDAEATAGWTIPSLGALLSGIHNLSFDGSAGRVPKDIKLLPEHLHAAGYASHAVVDNNIVEVRVGFGGGFESYFQRSGYRFAFSLPAFRALPTRFREKLREHLYTSYYGSPGVTDVARERLRSHYKTQSRRPLFLYAHYMDPHAPYHLHKNLKPDPPEAEPIDYYEFRDILRADRSLKPTEGQLARLVHRYENELRFMDVDLASLIQEFREVTEDEGLVVLTSDHGEEFLDHGRLGHGSTVYREMVNVPLMIWWPKSRRSELQLERIDNRPLTLLDLTPTLLDVLEVEPLPSSLPIEGDSFLSGLRDPALPLRTKPMIASHSRNGRRTYRLRDQDTVVLMTHYYDDRASEYEVYSLDDDPLEKTNLALNDVALKNELIARLTKEIRRLEKAEDATADEEIEANEEALRALGYIE